jgi:predicted enzyme related to lactoylglutathione lyase
MANPVVHFEIIGNEATQLQNFYRNVFSWELAPEPNANGYAVVQNGGITGGIGACPVTAGHVTFYVGVDDIDASLRAIEDLGGKTLRGPIELPNNRGKFAHFEDPQGHMLGLVQPA